MTGQIGFPNGIQPNAFSKIFINKLKRELHRLLKVSLKEDLNELGDVTSNAILTDDKKGNAKIIAKQNGIFSGGFVVKMVYFHIDPSLKVSLNVKEGDLIHNKETVIYIEGPLKNILIGERTALNFLARMSGIATLTRKFVEALKDSNIQILDTRKTLPGWRYLDKYAVWVGGGQNHRIGLFDMVLIKENHITAAGGIKSAVNLCKKYLANNNLNLKIEVEAKNSSEVKEALETNIDRIMLDNMTIDQIQKAVALVNGRTALEISGGVNLENIKNYVHTGVSYISIGQLTHSANAFDYSLLIN